MEQLCCCMFQKMGAVFKELLASLGESFTQPQVLNFSWLVVLSVMHFCSFRWCYFSSDHCNDLYFTETVNWWHLCSKSLTWWCVGWPVLLSGVLCCDIQPSLAVSCSASCFFVITVTIAVFVVLKILAWFMWSSEDHRLGAIHGITKGRSPHCSMEQTWFSSWFVPSHGLVCKSTFV